MTSEYASAVARRYVDFKSPLAAYAKIPRSYVVLQRINLGLFAILGRDVAAPPTGARSRRRSGRSRSPRRRRALGEAEAGWRARARRARPPALALARHGEQQ